ncbi:MAG: TadE/TadG family type IV pilus assembly protein [Achromobacter sp.]|uniref:TadE/TadG family type IV pilus assembly protein n=1 Tax=Achromobacter sp. TaxID=134375 RepID=UPI003CFD4439
MHPLPTLRVPRAGRGSQRGIAALEFSLTLVMLLMFICGVLGFGALFWMQQQLASAATDGARAAVFARFNGQADVPSAACAAAMSAFSSGSAVGCEVSSAPCGWAGAEGSQADCATVAMTYDTQSWPLLATLQGLITSVPGMGTNWIPSRLRSQAIVQISQGTP